jgi:hypothetical protein
MSWPWSCQRSEFILTAGVQQWSACGLSYAWNLSPAINLAGGNSIMRVDVCRDMPWEPTPVFTSSFCVCRACRPATLQRRSVPGTRCARRRWTASACCWSPARTTTRGASELLVCTVHRSCSAQKMHALRRLGSASQLRAADHGTGYVQACQLPGGVGLSVPQRGKLRCQHESCFPHGIITAVSPALQAGLRQEPVGGPGAVGAPALARRGAGHPPLERHSASFNSHPF